ncbi:Retrovirus-related Pol polyprotein from type-1 retrotransposable element R1 4 [Eumeta japonica]|uniref:Retrovirus-related Pol polyprotein from type-1 retrotransposable element R1 4 n=1 Tax=Eumeta variegata TaxID=151549 RepID=A0A4C1TU48_EUMVA|nr:Retrovirus-related Pol polyprotein from type-1 retrotransposable element R1 4 [Eumeta japonica]
MENKVGSGSSIKVLKLLPEELLFLCLQSNCSDWVEPDQEFLQLLTGHGCFLKRLHDLVLNDTRICLCGLTDDDIHYVLWCCPLYAKLRTVMVRAGVSWRFYDSARITGRLERPWEVVGCSLLTTEPKKQSRLISRLHHYNFPRHKKYMITSLRRIEDGCAYIIE